jgi:hypothetical protein
MRKTRINRSLSLFLPVLILLLFSACSSTGQQAPAGQQNPVESGEDLSPSAGEQIPTPRIELAATDPDMVVLAAGKPQLVEFFAFW